MLMRHMHMGIIMDIIICCFISALSFPHSSHTGCCKEDTIHPAALSTLFDILHGISFVFRSFRPLTNCKFSRSYCISLNNTLQ